MLRQRQEDTLRQNKAARAGIIDNIPLQAKRTYSSLPPGPLWQDESTRRPARPEEIPPTQAVWEEISPEDSAWLGRTEVGNFGPMNLESPDWGRDVQFLKHQPSGSMADYAALLAPREPLEDQITGRTMPPSGNMAEYAKLYGAPAQTEIADLPRRRRPPAE